MRFIRLASLVVCVCTGPLLAFEPPFAVKGEMSGIARVVDGDGIAINGIEVRMQGIAAQEDNGIRTDPSGRDATQALTQLAEG